VIKEVAQRLSKSQEEDMKLYDIAERLEQVMWREKKMFANLDWYSAVSYHRMACPPRCHPIFVVSRTRAGPRISSSSESTVNHPSGRRLYRPETASAAVAEPGETGDVMKLRFAFLAP